MRTGHTSCELVRSKLEPDSILVQVRSKLALALVLELDSILALVLGNKLVQGQVHSKLELGHSKLVQGHSNRSLPCGIRTNLLR